MRYLPRYRGGGAADALPDYIDACDFCGTHAGTIRSYVLGRLGHPTTGNAVRVDACLRCRLAGAVERERDTRTAEWDRPNTFYPSEVRDPS